MPSMIPVFWLCITLLGVMVPGRPVAQTSRVFFQSCRNAQTLPAHWPPDRLVLRGGRWGKQPDTPQVVIIPDSGTAQLTIYPRPQQVTARKEAEESLTWQVQVPPPPAFHFEWPGQVRRCGDTLQWQAGMEIKVILSADSLFAALCPQDARYVLTHLQLFRHTGYGGEALVATLAGETPQVLLEPLLRGRPTGIYALRTDRYARLDWNDTPHPAILARPCELIIVWE
ncbi:MAG: hypothetical protein KF690_10560 [Bacteroidetes bacterium]|nr:hypothetical protein [Bacteroidota bacterium]